MSGILFSILAGVFMSIQGVLNTRVSNKIGLWETNAFVQGTAFLVSLIVLIFIHTGNFNKIFGINKLYLLGGVLGVGITYSVMKGIHDLGPTFSISTILIAQLVAAALIDMLGLFETQRIPFSMSKVIGVLIMIAGIIIFKYK